MYFKRSGCSGLRMHLLALVPACPVIAGNEKGRRFRDAQFGFVPYGRSDPLDQKSMPPVQVGCCRLEPPLMMGGLYERSDPLDQKSMPPMPPPGMAGAASFFGSSATMASVVTSRPATEAGVLQGSAHDLGRVDDAGLDHVDIGLVLGVEAEGVPLLEHLRYDDRAFDAGVDGDLGGSATQGRRERS